MILVVPSARIRAQFAAPNLAAACSAKHLDASAKVGDFVFASYRNKDEGTACLQVFRSGKVVFRSTNDDDGDYFVGQHPNGSRNWDVPSIANGTDITGRGHPDMIVSQYTGGAHCCLLTYVFELEPVFKLLTTLNAEDSWPAYFADIGRSHHYYYFANDWTFAYWPSSFAGSPSAPVVLRYVQDGRVGSYHLALDKMRRPAPTSAEWNKDLKDARATFAAGAWQLFIGATLWDTVLHLIYSGHADLAWKFLNEAWPPKTGGKNEWLGDFCSVLKSSPYWPDLENSVRDAPEACASVKPRQHGR